MDPQFLLRKCYGAKYPHLRRNRKHAVSREGRRPLFSTDGDFHEKRDEKRRSRDFVVDASGYSKTERSVSGKNIPRPRQECFLVLSSCV